MRIILFSNDFIQTFTPFEKTLVIYFSINHSFAIKSLRRNLERVQIWQNEKLFQKSLQTITRLFVFREVQVDAENV